jgi:DNA polymerase V
VVTKIDTLIHASSIDKLPIPFCFTNSGCCLYQYIELDEVGTPRQQIVVSRSFGQEVSNLDDLKESIAYFTTTAAEKLRKDSSVASSVCVFILTNPFKPNEPQYQRSIVVPIPTPTDNTITLVNAATSGLNGIYQAGFRYKKAV